MLAVRAPYSVRSVYLQVYGEARHRGLSKKRLYQDRAEISQKRSQKLIAFYRYTFEKGFSHQGMTLSIRWTVDSVIVDWQSKYNITNNTKAKRINIWMKQAYWKKSSRHRKQKNKIYYNVVGIIDLLIVKKMIVLLSMADVKAKR